MSRVTHPSSKYFPISRHPSPLRRYFAKAEESMTIAIFPHAPRSETRGAGHLFEELVELSKDSMSLSFQASSSR